MSFFEDKVGQNDLQYKDQLFNDSDNDVEMENDSVSEKDKKKKNEEIDWDGFRIDMGWEKKPKDYVSKDLSEKVKELIDRCAPLENVLKKAIVGPDFEKTKVVPEYDVSDKKAKKRRKSLRQDNKGRGWFNLPAPEMTDEIKNDLEVIQMRSALDPKRFYKKNDLKVLPKYFQIGKVVDTPLDYYNGRLTKKERKKTLVDELMADAEFAKYIKRKLNK